jgi:predicted lysophospholipase L1 biosynthesis ABC-type transport system permease subunit
VLKFNSMVQRANATPPTTGAVLADVKAVAVGYPLRSAIMLADPDHPEGVAATGIPPLGDAWPDARLAQRLGLKVGDAIAVGDAVLNIGAIVQQEPEVASGLLGTRLAIADQHRRCAGDQPAAAGQSRDVSVADRRRAQ